MDPLQVAVFVIVGIAGLAYLVSLVRRDSHRETKNLAETRGERIDDLEDEVAQLEGRVSALEAHIKAVETIKAKEIAVQVATLLEPRLPRRDDLGSSDGS